MRILKHYTKLLLICGLLFSISACKKNVDGPLTPVSINLPATVSMTYGEQQELALPSSLTTASDLQIKLDFSQNTNVSINASSKLQDKIAQAITVDEKSGKIKINSTLLYPNGAVSAASGVQLPDSYKLTISASSVKQSVEGKQTIDVKIKAAALNVKNLDNTTEIPVAYVLYGDAANFDLETGIAIPEGAVWNVENKSTLGTDLSWKSNQLQFSANAGDPDKKAEKSYDVISSLQKDGFSVARRMFRVFFIPRIKFFYGTYYADLNLTLLFNNLHIALSNGYVSSAPTLYPEKYKSSFSIVSIEKDGASIDNNQGIFEINAQTGAITVKKNTTLTAGSYKFTVQATTTTGLTFNTTLTLNMSKG